MVHRVKRVRAAAAPDRHHRRADFPPEQPAVGQRHQPGAIQQRLHFRAHVGEISRRAEDDRVRRDHFLKAWVERIVLLAAPGVLLFETGITGLAAADGLAADLDELGFPAGGGQRRQHLFQKNFSVPALSRTSIDGNSFHSQIGKPIFRLNPAMSMTNEIETGPRTDARERRRGGDGGEGSLVTPKSDEGGSETQAEVQLHGKGWARGGTFIDINIRAG